MHGRQSTTAVRVTLITILIFFGGVIFFAHEVNSRRAQTATTQPPTKYTNYVYKISLTYPSDWQPTAGYNYDHYEGPSGFFALSAAGTATSSIDGMVKDEIQQVSRPYGSSPTTEVLSIAKHDARLILPAGDQPTSFHGQAALIVRYSKEIVVSGRAYDYLVLWADKDHIRQIGDSISFVEQ